MSIKERYSTLTLFDVGGKQVGDDVVLEYKDYIIQPTMTLKSGFYKNTAENNRLDKTPYLTLVNELTGAFRSDISITNPTLRYLSETPPNFNYVIIESLGRCYYVKNATYIAKGLWDLELKVDVLMSFKNAILSKQALITKNQYDYNLMIPNDEIPLTQVESITQQVVTNDLFDSSNGSYVLQGLMVSYSDGETPIIIDTNPIGTWVWYDDINTIVDITGKEISVNFSTNDETYDTFIINSSNVKYKNSTSGVEIEVYSTTNGWDATEYKTIVITSIDTTQTYYNNFLYYLNNNATKEGELNE